MFFCKEGIYLQYVYLQLLLLNKNITMSVGGPVNLHHTSLSISFWLEAHCFDVFFSSYWYLVSPADSNKNKVQKGQQYAMMFIYLGNILHVCNSEFEFMYICTNKYTYTYSLFIFYPVTIFWLTLLTILFALATAPGSSWVRSARSCETDMGNCASNHFPPLLHTGTCSCTQGHQLWSNLQMRVQLHNQSVATHEYQYQFCIFCKIRFDGRNPAPVDR